MSYVNELKSKHGGLTAHIVKTEKFKTVSLIFKMLAPLTKDQVTKRASSPACASSRNEKPSENRRIAFIPG